MSRKGSAAGEEFAEGERSNVAFAPGSPAREEGVPGAPVNVSVVDEHADAVHSQSKKDPRQFATKVENDGEQ